MKKKQNKKNNNNKKNNSAIEKILNDGMALIAKNANNNISLFDGWKRFFDLDSFKSKLVMCKTNDELKALLDEYLEVDWSVREKFDIIEFCKQFNPNIVDRLKLLLVWS